MDQTSDSHDETQDSKKDSLPISQAVPPQAPIQQNIATVPPGQTRAAQRTEDPTVMPVRVVNIPLSTRDIGDSELSEFERKSIRFSRWSFYVAAVTLAAIIVTAIVFWEQFREMAAQTDILGISARQARRDSAAASLATARQLGILQRQESASQRQVAVLGKAFEAAERPYLGVQKVEFTEDESAKIMHIVISFKNFGANTAQALRLYYTTAAQGQVRGGSNMLLGRQGGVLLPGNVRRLPATINGVDFSGLRAGFGGCTVQTTALYQWNKKQYQYCEVWSYNNETKSFEPVDACSPSISRGRYPGDTATLPQYPN